MTTSAKACVMGWPVAHSRSPLIHNHWLTEYGIDGSYDRQAVVVEELAAALRHLAAEGYVGCNLTLPHKVAALSHLDRLTSAARDIGAANTVQVLPGGLLVGHNTDAYGYIENLRETAPSWQPCSGRAIVLGAGGAARAVAYALAEAGVPELCIVNRSVDKAAALATDMRQACQGVRVSAHEWTDRTDPDLLNECALLVNTTELGMQGKGPLDMPLDHLPPHAVVSDIVYAPLITPLLRTARGRGLAISDGLGMLLYQAQAAFEIWFGVKPTVSSALRAKIEADLSSA